MKEEKEIHKRVNEAFESLNGLEDVKAPPFFYTRLKAKREGESKPVISWILKPAFVLPGILLALTLNVFTITQITSAEKNTQTENYLELNSNYEIDIY